MRFSPFALAALLSILVSSATHAFDVTVGASSTNGAWTGNTWTPSAAGSTVAASEIQTRLASGNVTITATGADTLTVKAGFVWSANTLTLAAGGDIAILAGLDGSGTAGLALEYGQSAVAAGNTSTYNINAPVNLASTGSFSTKLGSDGTAVNYTILTSLGAQGSTTGTDLQGMEGNWAGNFALGADIDASATATWNGGLGFRPIAHSDNIIAGFTGRLDGLGHVIDQLTINRPGNYNIGLFGNSSVSTVANLGLLRVSITGKTGVGGLAGEAYALRLNNSYVTGTVSGENMVGGLIGRDPPSRGSVKLSNVYSTATVTATQVGDGTAGMRGVVGGLVGLGVSTIKDSYATGAVSGGNYVGGLVGILITGTSGDAVSNSYFSGTVTANGSPYGLGAIANGFVGSAVLTNVFWNSDTTGASAIGAGPSTLTNVAGLTTAQMRDAANFTGFTFTTTPGGSGWVLVGSDGTFNGSNGTVLPMLASEWSAAIGNAHQLQLMAMERTASYTLARDIDAAATNAGAHDVWLASSFMPVGKMTAGFTGILDGLGHAVSGLTVNRAALADAGLFGQLDGTVRDLGLVGGSVTGGHAGMLAGTATVAISKVYATGGSVTGTGNASGGLVGGMLSGSLQLSYAAVSVQGTGSNGGLAGQSGGAISNCYATGSVSTTSFSQSVGGLVGYQIAGSIDNSYAVGAVGGSGTKGGLVGAKSLSSNVGASYWDIQTSGQAGSAGGAGAEGKTTAEMKSLATFAGWDIDNAGGTGKVWRIYEGHTYPLLRGFFTATLSVTANNASKTYDGAAYAGGNGVSYSATPDANLLGTLSYGGTAQGASAVGSYTLIPAGLYSNQRGYDITFVSGTLTINTAPAPDPDPPPPTLIVAGPGSTTTLTGTTPVTASPGSIIVIPTGANVAGVAITLAGPSGGGEAGPVSFKIGNLTLTLSGYTPGTVVSFKKVMVNGVETLVLVVTSGKLTLSGQAGQPLLTLNGTATLTAGTDGTAVGFSANADGGGTIAVTAGYIELTADAFATRGSRATAMPANGRIYAGERANFGADGKIVQVKLGSAPGESGGAGDALELSLAGNLSFATTVPKLDATSSRLGRSVQEALAAAAGATLAGSQSNGVLALDIGGARVHALPLGEVLIDTDAVDGAILGADGTATVSIQGVSARFAPSVADVGQLARDVGGPFPWPSIEVSRDGVLRARGGGETYVLRPAWVAETVDSTTAGFGVDTAGRMSYTQSGAQYALQAAVADWATLAAAVEEALPGATLKSNPDGSVTVTQSRQSLTLKPEMKLEAAPAGTRAWWAETDGSLRLHNTDGSAQGFAVE